MTGRLSLLSPARSPTAVSILSVEEVNDGDEAMRNLYQDSLTTTLGLTVHDWSDARKRAQVQEWTELQRSIIFDGMQGWPVRDEGGFDALPPENGERRWGLLPLDPLPDVQNLKGLPALRIYCTRHRQSLVLLYATVKTEDAWQACSYARPYGGRARALASAIDKAIDAGDLVCTRGHLDPTKSFTFQIPTGS